MDYYKITLPFFILNFIIIYIIIIYIFVLFDITVEKYFDNETNIFINSFFIFSIIVLFLYFIKYIFFELNNEIINYMIKNNTFGINSFDAKELQIIKLDIKDNIILIFASILPIILFNQKILQKNLDKLHFGIKKSFN